jgi:hypothetical protein
MRIAAGHALVGCASSAASGGSCESGALSGAVGSALSPLTRGIFPDARTDLGQRIGGTIMEATAGGLASVAGGGKFANGAVTGAFGYLFNDLMVNANGKLTYVPSQIGSELDVYEDFAANPQHTYPLLLPLGALGAAIFGDTLATTTLYRAVSQAEFDQLIGSGSFQSSANSLEGKWFAESAADAARWGKILNGTDFTVIETQFPRSAADSFMRVPRLDGIGPARFGTLDAINAARPAIRPLQ